MVMGADFSLQTEDYMVMVTEQGRTRNELRQKAYLSCGILERMHGLSIFTNSVNWGQEAPWGCSVVVSLHSVPGIANGIEHRLYEICNCIFQFGQAFFNRECAT